MNPNSRSQDGKQEKPLFRLFVRLNGAHNKNVPSKVIAVHQNWTWETLLLNIGHKFDVIVGGK
jgi:hypothetical protein